jgi:hypothetical protein
MMYSFAARGDFTVMDEPFYGAYLAATGAEHPMRREILGHHETDPEKVAASCVALVSTPHLYMKHMPHHMVPGFPINWAKDCVNIHLIRHPVRVIASYSAKREEPSLDDIGYVQQARLFGQIGGLVIDSTDIRADPERMLRALCDGISLPFDPAMLHWPAGPRPEDGIWARHWYGAVHRSTGFAGAEGDMPKLDARGTALADEAMPYYETLVKYAIR